jgi:epoxyqueuosine reductase
MSKFESTQLSDAGLNLQAAFNIADLPDHITKALNTHCENFGTFSQLLLVAHGGRAMWDAVSNRGFTTDNPIDDYAVNTVGQYFAAEHPDNNYEIVYPGNFPIGLRDLGDLAGWHHDSPFRVGIQAQWGTWFAYRAVILTDTNFAPTVAMPTASPCDECIDKPCISICPAKAVAEEALDLESCLDHRMQEKSSCVDTCLSRLACPVGLEHRYSKDQINYHYGRSMKVIRELRRPRF